MIWVAAPEECAERALPVVGVEEQLAGAKYTVWGEPGPAGDRHSGEEDSDMDDGSASDSGSGSEGGSSGEEEASSKKKGKSAAKGRKSSDKSAVEAEKDVTSVAGSKKRKRGEADADAGSSKRPALGDGSKGEPEPRAEPAPTVLSYEQRRDMNIARNKAAVATLQKAYEEKEGLATTSATQGGKAPAKTKAKTKPKVQKAGVTKAPRRSGRRGSSSQSDTVGSEGGGGSDREGEFG
jgi:hypothetical protein